MVRDLHTARGPAKALHCWHGISGQMSTSVSEEEASVYTVMSESCAWEAWHRVWMLWCTHFLSLSCRHTCFSRICFLPKILHTPGLEAYTILRQDHSHLLLVFFIFFLPFMSLFEDVVDAVDHQSKTLELAKLWNIWILVHVAGTRPPVTQCVGKSSFHSFKIICLDISRLQHSRDVHYATLCFCFEI